MKQKRVIIPLLITACFLLVGKYDVQAATTLENQYTNPYYKAKRQMKRKTVSALRKGRNRNEANQRSHRQDEPMYEPS